MTSAQILHFKSALEAKRDEFMREIRAQTGELAIGGGENDPLDQVQSMAQRDQAVMLVQRKSRALSDVKAALQAILEGVYGICVECEEPISMKRLETIPWASHCIRCQEALELRQSAQEAGPTWSYAA